jgi:hypothetical protein
MGHAITRGNHAELPDSSDLRDLSGKLRCRLLEPVYEGWNAARYSRNPSIIPLGGRKESSLGHVKVAASISQVTRVSSVMAYLRLLLWRESS